MIWLHNFGLLFILGTALLYWCSPQHSRTWLLAACGALLLINDGWHTLLAWGALIAWVILICGCRWSKPAHMQLLGQAGLLIAFFTYQYSKGWHGLLPYLGFVFATLKAWHLIAEYGNDVPRQRGIITYVAYLLFPPALVVGPIQRYDAFRLELMRARWEGIVASQALERLLYGYCKVILLANYLLRLRLNGLADLTGHAWLDAYLGLVGYGLDLYWQFSGYTDIAIGFAALLGIRVPENFNFPFAARSLPDFWRRWHITLSEWCRDFVFRPIFTRSHHYLYASLCSMMVLGLWHELSPRYLAWGLFHGVGLSLVHLWSKHMPLAGKLQQYKLWRIACWFFTLQFVLLSFAFTSTTSMVEAFRRLGILMGL